jgi:hypothetical protein
MLHGEPPGSHPTVAASSVVVQGCERPLSALDRARKSQLLVRSRAYCRCSFSTTDCGVPPSQLPMALNPVLVQVSVVESTWPVTILA